MRFQLRGQREKRRATVRTTVPKKHKLWGYGYPTLAALFGAEVNAVRQWVNRGKFKPDDLASIARFWAERSGWTPPPKPRVPSIPRDKGDTCIEEGPEDDARCGI